MRSLSANEVATIRAALRLWVETPPSGISPDCFLELAGFGALPDRKVEALLVELTGEPIITLMTTSAPLHHDAGRTWPPDRQSDR